MNKKKLILILLSVIFSAHFLTYCVPDMEGGGQVQKRIVSTNDFEVVSTNNFEVVFYMNSDFSGYETFTNLVHYEVYELKKSYYALIIEAGKETISNFKRFSYITNYFTNVLITNTIAVLITNQTFQTVNDDFRISNHGYHYQLISDDSILGYSNYFQGTSVKINHISEFGFTNTNDLDLTGNNPSPSGITIYNDNLYITDSTADKVFIYNNTGIYQNQFNLHNDNSIARGITTYKNNFYIVDKGSDKVFVYNNTGIYKNVFDLTSGHGSPYGITTYTSNFYIINNPNSPPRRVYLYNSTRRYESNTALSSAYLNDLLGVVAYNNKLYIVDNFGAKIYVYNISGTIYQDRFNLHSNNTDPRGIAIYNNSFYIIDSASDGGSKKVYIYPID